jgi:hypothetical protein
LIGLGLNRIGRIAEVANTRATWGNRTTRYHYTVEDFDGLRWISRMSPWCTLAALPLLQAIVTASQLVSVTVP